jgi:nitroimidazol reductase NimA-like FMN-containing flavoprotein (pyridoxamine 5'-phosphate oxidase superfamily)
VTIDDDAARSAIAALLSEQKLAVIATMSADHPYCNLVAYTPSNDLRTILFVTPRRSTKFENLSRNPCVSLLVDNRSQAGSDAQTGMAVTGIGTVVAIRDQDAEAFRQEHARRHAALAEFILSPDCAPVHIRVSRYILVSKLRAVSVLDLTG